MTIVVLHPEQTAVQMTDEIRTMAIQAASWVTCSPCEWVWTPNQQAAMAQYVLWAMQRLDAINQLSDHGKPLTRT